MYTPPLPRQPTQVSGNPLYNTPSESHLFLKLWNPVLVISQSVDILFTLLVSAIPYPLASLMNPLAILFRFWCFPTCHSSLLHGRLFTPLQYSLPSLPLAWMPSSPYSDSWLPRLCCLPIKCPPHHSGFPQLPCCVLSSLCVGASLTLIACAPPSLNRLLWQAVRTSNGSMIESYLKGKREWVKGKLLVTCFLF